MDLLLTREGKIFQNNWNSDNEDWDKEFIDPNRVLSYLHYSIELDEGFTLRDYFKMVINYPDLQKLDLFFTEFINEYFKCPQGNCICEDIKHLELNYVASYECKKTIEFDEPLFGEKIQDMESHVDIFIDFFGMGTDDETHWGLDFLDLDNLLDFKIVLGPAKVSIEKEGDYKDYDNLKEKFIVKESKNCHYSFYDFVHTIIYELPFHGNKEQKKERMDEIQESVEEVQELIDKKD